MSPTSYQTALPRVSGCFRNDDDYTTEARFCQHPFFQKKKFFWKEPKTPAGGWKRDIRYGEKLDGFCQNVYNRLRPKTMIAKQQSFNAEAGFFP